MTRERTLIDLPDDLPDDARQRLQELARESRPEPAPLVVDEYLIRHWCESFEDGNPLYLDEEYARSRGFRSVIAPPGAFVSTFSFPIRWPWPSGDGEPSRHINFDVKEALELPVGIVRSFDVELLEPLQIGDRISVSQRLISVSAWKETRVGKGRFYDMQRLYRNQSGALVAVETMAAFGYGRDSEPPVEEPQVAHKPQGGWSPSIEEVLEADRTGYRPIDFTDRCWEDVEEGEELPELVVPITFTRCVYLASATRDFSPQHTNRDFAQGRSRTRDVFISTPMNVGMVSRFTTDWAGPRAAIRKINVSMQRNVCAGDDMVLTGKVMKKYANAGDHRVDLEIIISTQDGPATSCHATLSLPVRNA